MSVTGIVGCQRVPPPPAPCADDHRIYTLADTVQGVREAEPKRIVLPRPTGSHGRTQLRLLVTPQGAVVRDSTQVIVSGGSAFDYDVREAVGRTRFRPATRGGCAVSFWFVLAVTR